MKHYDNNNIDVWERYAEVSQAEADRDALITYIVAAILFFVLGFWLARWWYGC